MKPSLFKRRRKPAFTLIELLVVISIIALLLSLALPNTKLMYGKAQSVKCAEQLHGIGVAVLGYAADNNAVLPEINQAAVPPYPPSVGGIVQVLGPYGVTTNTTQCPTDMPNGTSSSFSTYGSSYEWNPVFDDGTDPVTTVPRESLVVSVNSARIRICTDFLPIHRGKVNALYGDGHVRAR